MSSRVNVLFPRSNQSQFEVVSLPITPRSCPLDPVSFPHKNQLSRHVQRPSPWLPTLILPHPGVVASLASTVGSVVHEVQPRKLGDANAAFPNNCLWCYLSFAISYMPFQFYAPFFQGTRK
ncbi:unnamed protein product, partial [Sphacelaria rigidula]